MVDKKGQPHLAVQDAATVDASKLTALTPEVVSAEIYLCHVFSIFANRWWCTAVLPYQLYII